MHFPAEHRLALGIATAVVTVWFVGMVVALRVLAPPAAASGRLLAIFPPAITDTQALQAIAIAGGRTFGQTWFRLGWDVLGEEPGFAGRLREHGAWVLTDLPLMPVLAGCSGASTARDASRRREIN
jgi:hypothetical protein